MYMVDSLQTSGIYSFHQSFFPPFNKSENFIRFSDLGPFSNFAMDFDPDLPINELGGSGIRTYAGLMRLNLNIKFKKSILHI